MSQPKKPSKMTSEEAIRRLFPKRVIEEAKQAALVETPSRKSFIRGYTASK